MNDFFPRKGGGNEYLHKLCRHSDTHEPWRECGECRRERNEPVLPKRLNPLWISLNTVENGISSAVQHLEEGTLGSSWMPGLCLPPTRWITSASSRPRSNKPKITKVAHLRCRVTGKRKGKAINTLGHSKDIIVMKQKSKNFCNKTSAAIGISGGTYTRLDRQSAFTLCAPQLRCPATALGSAWQLRSALSPCSGSRGQFLLVEDGVKQTPTVAPTQACEQHKLKLQKKEVETN